METRKVQFTGGSTYTVSLPKEWASENGLDPGTQVALYPHIDGSLVLRASERQNGEATRLRIRADRVTDDLLASAVRAGYVSGHDVMVLEDVDRSHRRAARTATSTMVGLEIVEEADSRIVLKCLLDSEDVSIRQTLIQLQFVSCSMHRDAMAALLAAADDRAERVVERDDEADRLFGMIERHFRRSLTNLEELDALGIERQTLFDFYTTARQLERVADHAEKVAGIAATLSHPPEPLVDDLDSHAGTVRGLVEDATGAVLGDVDVDLAFDALERRDAATADLTSLTREIYEGSGDDRYPLALVVDSLSRTAEYGGNIAETAIRAAARTGDI